MLQELKAKMLKRRSRRNAHVHKVTPGQSCPRDFLEALSPPCASEDKKAYFTEALQHTSFRYRRNAAAADILGGEALSSQVQTL